MRFSDDHLKLKALVALNEASERLGIVPDHAVRFTLAWLYSNTAQDRTTIDQFWRLVAQRPETRQDETVRQQLLVGAENRIFWTAGMELTVPMAERVKAARKVRSGQR